MRALRWTLYGLVALLGLGLLVGTLLPGDYQVERSIDIAAPAPVVFDQVNDLRKWPTWSPWIAHDPSIDNTYSGSPLGEGQTVEWTSEHSGSGSQTITLSRPPQRIETHMDFGSMGVATTDWTFESKAGGVRVTWGLSGDTNGPIGHYFALMMDSLVGPDYEEGLRRLKAHAETLAGRMGPEAGTKEQAPAP